MLAWYNCFSYQGYLFSRPLPLLEFEQYVADLQSKRDSV
jgi:EAL domain-containing protein (putative c-di-GMP-specific phosphodiesterase class I)